jgi:hypothetical protein
MDAWVLFPFSTKLCDLEQKNSLSNNPLMAKADLEYLVSFFLTLKS